MKVSHLATMAEELDATPGTVSVCFGGLRDKPAYARDEHAVHYAASTMKVAVLVALYRAAEAERVALHRPVPVRNWFVSAATGAPAFGCDPGYDNDDEPWRRVGWSATPAWLAHRMITRSSNLATNIVLDLAGLPAVAEVWRQAGAERSVTGRGIEDKAAEGRGITNLVTAYDLCALLAALTRGGLAGPQTTRAMLAVLLDQRRGEDLAAGLPAGTRIAHKNGWVPGVHHAAGVVFPTDTPPYVLAVCTTADLPDEAASALLARVSAAAWADRHTLGA